jgi:hypothetical protein
MVLLTRINVARGMLGLILWSVGVPAFAQSPVSPLRPASDVAAPWHADRQHTAARAAADTSLHVNSARRVQATNRRGRRALSCGSKLLWGLGIGAGLGATYGTLLRGRADEPAKFTAATTTLFGLVGLAVGYGFCR